MTTIEYLYTLPGDVDELQAEAYSHGLNTLPRMILESMPPYPQFNRAYVTNMPREREDIETLARELAKADIKDNGPQLTNKPEMYIEESVKGFTEGYLFALFALSRGLLELLHSLPQDDRYKTVYAFAWELKIKEPAIPEPENADEERIVTSVESIKAVYKQYKRLN